MFNKNDHVTTKMGRLPPSPCKCCGSSNHWDRECPDHSTFLEKTSKSGYINEQNTDRDDEPYQSAFGILLSQRLASMQVDESKIQQGFDEAAHCDQTIVVSSGCKSKVKARIACKTTIEEVEDEFWEEERNRPKSASHILCHASDKEPLNLNTVEERPAPSKHPTKQTTIEEIEDEAWEAHHRKPKSSKHIMEPMNEADDSPPSQEETCSNLSAEKLE
jgi:hypothetical protein